MTYYMDTSALAKLVIAEDGTESLRRWCVSHDGELVTSDLTRTELLRAVVRAREAGDAGPDAVDQAHAVLDAVDLVAMPREVFTTAGMLAPSSVRTLDALHLAVAIDLGLGLDGLVTYDRRLADAARHWGIEAIAPGDEAT